MEKGATDKGPPVVEPALDLPRPRHSMAARLVASVRVARVGLGAAASGVVGAASQGTEQGVAAGRASLGATLGVAVGRGGSPPRATRALALLVDQNFLILIFNFLDYIHHHRLPRSSSLISCLCPLCSVLLLPGSLTFSIPAHSVLQGIVVGFVVVF